MVCDAPGIGPFSLTNQIKEIDQMRGAWDSGFVRFILFRGAAVSLTFSYCNLEYSYLAIVEEDARFYITQGQFSSIDF